MGMPAGRAIEFARFHAPHQLFKFRSTIFAAIFKNGHIEIARVTRYSLLKVTASKITDGSIQIMPHKRAPRPPVNREASMPILRTRSTNSEICSDQREEDYYR